MEELTKKLYEQKLNEINELNSKIIELSEYLKKYTIHKGSKIYYQKNKEYNKRSYENRKKIIK
jgi:hypothetical protein